MDEKINVITTNNEVTPAVSPPIEKGPREKKRINKKTIILVLAILLVVVEMIWAGRTLLKSAPPTQNLVTQNEQSVATPLPEAATISLTSAVSAIKVSEAVKVDINMESANHTNGTDIIVLYDPKYLAVEDVKVPATLGTLYSAYPVNAVDLTTGRVIISGVSTIQEGIIPNGLFGSINFKTLLAGKTQIKIYFQGVGLTTDSNVTIAGKGIDILTGVNNLELEVLP